MSLLPLRCSASCGAMSLVKATCPRVAPRNGIEGAGAVDGDIGGLESASAAMFADRDDEFCIGDSKRAVPAAAVRQN